MPCLMVTTPTHGLPEGYTMTKTAMHAPSDCWYCWMFDTDRPHDPNPITGSIPVWKD